mmetsp:Transcript_124647/g.285525  ORF Transcript_124647/g.285525 Transcript_124647/m.285525 type:complete len:1317 (+) Transcript_124647:85-4035(+)
MEGTSSSVDHEQLCKRQRNEARGPEPAVVDEESQPKRARVDIAAPFPAISQAVARPANGVDVAALQEVDGQWGDCAICFAEKAENPMQLACRHVFCRECLALTVTAELQAGRECLCPGCRQPLGQAIVSELDPSTSVPLHLILDAEILSASSSIVLAGLGKLALRARDSEFLGSLESVVQAVGSAMGTAWEAVDGHFIFETPEPGAEVDTVMAVEDISSVRVIVEAAELLQRLADRNGGAMAGTGVRARCAEIHERLDRHLGYYNFTGYGDEAVSHLDQALRDVLDAIPWTREQEELYINRLQMVQAALESECRIDRRVFSCDVTIGGLTTQPRISRLISQANGACGRVVGLHEGGAVVAMREGQFEEKKPAFCDQIELGVIEEVLYCQHDSGWTLRGDSALAQAGEVFATLPTLVSKDVHRAEWLLLATVTRALRVHDVNECWPAPLRCKSCDGPVVTCSHPGPMEGLAAALFYDLLPARLTRIVAGPLMGLILQLTLTIQRKRAVILEESGQTCSDFVVSYELRQQSDLLQIAPVAIHADGTADVVVVATGEVRHHVQQGDIVGVVIERECVPPPEIKVGWMYRVAGPQTKLAQVLSVEPESEASLSETRSLSGSRSPSTAPGYSKPTPFEEEEDGGASAKDGAEGAAGQGDGAEQGDRRVHGQVAPVDESPQLQVRDWDTGAAATAGQPRNTQDAGRQERRRSEAGPGDDQPNESAGDASGAGQPGPPGPEAPAKRVKRFVWMAPQADPTETPSQAWIPPKPGSACSEHLARGSPSPLTQLTRDVATCLAEEGVLDETAALAGYIVATLAQNHRSVLARVRDLRGHAGGEQGPVMIPGSPGLFPTGVVARSPGVLRLAAMEDPPALDLGPRAASQDEQDAPTRVSPAPDPTLPSNHSTSASASDGTAPGTSGLTHTAQQMFALHGALGLVHTHLTRSKGGLVRALRRYFHEGCNGRGEEGEDFDVPASAVCWIRALHGEACLDASPEAGIGTVLGSLLRRYGAAWDGSRQAGRGAPQSCQPAHSAAVSNGVGKRRELRQNAPAPRMEAASEGRGLVDIMRAFVLAFPHPEKDVADESTPKSTVAEPDLHAGEPGSQLDPGMCRVLTWELNDHEPSNLQAETLATTALRRRPPEVVVEVGKCYDALIHTHGELVAWPVRVVADLGSVYQCESLCSTHKCVREVAHENIRKRGAAETWGAVCSSRTLLDLACRMLEDLSDSPIHSGFVQLQVRAVTGETIAHFVQLALQVPSSLFMVMYLVRLVAMVLRDMEPGERATLGPVLRQCGLLELLEKVGNVAIPQKQEVLEFLSRIET